MGLYPLCPGDSRFEITSPVFEEATIRLHMGIRRARGLFSP
ncbi:glycoside hydrolase domain-containing protein [Puia dinghuensis]